jgi:hypothetical protein
MVIDRKKLEDDEFQIYEEIFPKSYSDFEKGIFNPKSLYPEFKFKEPYGLEPLNDEPIYSVFPFYEQVIVHVGPFPKEEFKKFYGISVESLTKLYIEDKILPVLSWRYEDYPSEFDGLFEAASRKDGHIPTSYRTSSFLNGINSEKGTFDEFYGIFSEKFKHSRFDDSITAIFKDDSNPEDKIINSMASCLFELKAFGYDKLYGEILEMENQNDVYWHLFWYSSFLTRPITLGLGGYSNYREEDFARLKMEEPIAPQFLLYKFPKEIEMYTPSKVGNPVKYWDKVEKITDRADVLDAFKDISSLVDKGNLEKANEVVMDISKQVTDISKEASKEAADISLESRRRYMDLAFSVATPFILGCVHPLIGGAISFVIWGFNEDWKWGINELSKLLGNNPKKTNIVPMMLLMKNIR